MIASVLILLPVAASAQILGVSHDGELRDGAIAWRSTVIASQTGVEGQESLTFAVPLVGDVTLESEDVEPILDERRQLIGVEVSQGAWVSDGARLILELRLRQRGAGEGTVTLRPPLLVTRALQKVRVQGADGVAFSPHPVLGLEHRFGSFLAPSTEQWEVRSLNRMLEGRNRMWGEQAVYLRVDPNLVQHGLTGTITSSQSRRGNAVLFVAGAFLVMIALFAVAYARLKREADAAHAERIVEREFGSLT